MPDITVSCPHCGELLEAPVALIGESVECPTCQTEFEISDPAENEAPDSSEAADDVEDGPEDDDGRCPNCGVEMAPDSVLCLACGFHTGMGKVIQTHFD